MTTINNMTAVEAVFVPNFGKRRSRRRKRCKSHQRRSRGTGRCKNFRKKPRSRSRRRRRKSRSRRRSNCNYMKTKDRCQTHKNSKTGRSKCKWQLQWVNSSTGATKKAHCKANRFHSRKRKEVKYR